MTYKDGIYFEVFAVKEGLRYNGQVISLNDVTKILTNSLLNGVQEIIMPKESEVAERREDIENSPVDCSTPSVTDSKGERNEQ